MAEIWAAAAVVGGAVVGAVGSNLAAGKQASAANNATNLQANEFNTITGQEQPYMTAGNQATSRLQDLLGVSGNKGAAGYGSLTAPFTAQDYLANQDPGYQFQLQTGAQALRNADTPGVGSLSGTALKDLVGFNQNMAATGYQNAFNRYQTQQNNTFARLSDLATTGQNAASNTGRAGATLAQGEANTTLAGGAASASGILGATGSLASGANTLGGLAYLQNSGNTAGSYNPNLNGLVADPVLGTPGYQGSSGGVYGAGGGFTPQNGGD